MEGILWKWTNYWNGWQTRWVVLENGVLSYYKSQEEVKQGCKGSMKVQACEINVSPIDHTRMDLVIPGEQHIYLKAETSPERQKWLIALGTAKACVTTNGKKAEDEKTPSDCFRAKKSELKLYCDLLMQQVHLIKSSVQSPNDIKIDNMDEATRILGVTCDTFIETLDECMKLTTPEIAKDRTNKLILSSVNIRKNLNRSNSEKT